MRKNFDKKLIGYAAAASAAALGGGYTAKGALITPVTFTGMPTAGGHLYDESNNPFLAMGDDVANNGTDPAVHLYVTNNKQSDSASYVTTGPIGAGALANLQMGTQLGSSLSSGLNWESNNTAPDNDIAYVDSATDTQYEPASFAGGTPSQYSIGTTGYFGFSFTPNGTPDYGYGSITYDDLGNTSVTYTYDDSGAPVTVEPFAVPEPTSLSMLALGSVAMLRRTRKV